METNIVPKVLMTPLYHLELVKDRDIPYDGSVKTTEQAAQVLHHLLDRSPTENMIVVYLNSSADLIGVERVGMGGMESVAQDHTEIFRGALVAGAPEILISHNHPNGDTRPSPADLHMTMTTVDLGALLHIRVRDHIIVGPNGKHLSIRENMHLFQDEMRQAEEMAFGRHMSSIKDKLLDLISKGPDLGADLLPKKGDPKANLLSDWQDSLTYAWLTR